MTWDALPLGDLATVLRGVTYKKAEARTEAAPGLMPLLRATNIGQQLNLTDGLVYVPDSRVSPQQMLRRGDIVVASSSGSLAVVGKGAILRSDWVGTFGAFCAAIRPERIDATYLGLYLASDAVRRRWSAAAKGTNINNLKLGDMTGTPVPVPPLAEQRRIAEILEDHLSRLDAAADYASAASRRTEALRDSTLASLFAEVGGEPLHLHNVASWSSGGTPKARVAAYYKDGEIPWCNSGDLNDGHIDSVPKAITQLGLDESSAKWVPAGSVLVAMYGATIGRVAINDVPMTTNQAVAAARPMDGLITTDYLFWFLRSQLRQLRRAGKGGAQPNISQTVLKNWPVVVPPMDRQHAVSSKASEIDSLTRRLQLQSQQIRYKCFSLRRALLAAAFSGQLTGRHVDNEVVEELAEAGA